LLYYLLGGVASYTTKKEVNKIKTQRRRFEVPRKLFGHYLRWLTPRKKFYGHPKTRGEPARQWLNKSIIFSILGVLKSPHYLPIPINKY
jgi:hypothetical protein